MRINLIKRVYGNFIWYRVDNGRESGRDSELVLMSVFLLPISPFAERFFTQIGSLVNQNC